MVLDRARRQPFVAQALSMLLAPTVAARNLVARTVALDLRSSGGGNATVTPGRGGRHVRAGTRR